MTDTLSTIQHMMRGNFKGSPVAYSLEEIDIAAQLPAGVTVSNNVLQNPVRNLEWEYLHFTNTDVFSPAANKFREYKKMYGEGKYTAAIKGTTEYRRFWKEEKRRCINGYEPIVDGVPCGIRITGEHYFYLNYSQIQRGVELATSEDIKQAEFPKFLLMDFYWFLELEKCENPVKYGLTKDHKRGLIMAKARRKGWSYKNAAGIAWKYTFFKNSYCIIAAYEEEFALTTFRFSMNILNWCEEHTPFRHARLVNKEAKGYIESGYITEVDGMEVKKGYRSAIQVMTFNKSGFKSAGKSATRMIFEEAGLFENLETAYTISEPLFREGKNMIGIPIIFGTGGDMTKATRDFHKMFYEPGKYGLKEYFNIYDENKPGYCGYFVDEMWFRVGKVSLKEFDRNIDLVDEFGNPCRWAAEYDLELERNLSKNSGDRSRYQKILTQHCKTPAEAFLVPTFNFFPTQELYERKMRLVADFTYKKAAIPGELIGNSDSPYAINGVLFKPDLEGKFNPLYDYPTPVNSNRDGCVVIYEPPITDSNGNVPKDMYIMGHDPYAVNSDQGGSLGAVYVYLSNHYLEYGHDKIVASYIARPSGGNSMGVYNYNMEKLSSYYGNAKIMFENTRGSVMEYFTKNKLLSRLLDEPGYVLSKVTGKKWKATRIKGCTMEPPRMKDQGELYIADWLLEKRGVDVDGRTIYNLDYIPDIGLLDELISYNRDGNFDRVMAFMQVVIALAETSNRYKEEKGIDEDKKEDKLSFLRNNRKLFPRRSYIKR